MNTTLNIAQWLANQGMHVFPLRPASKRPLRNCPHCTGNACGQPANCCCLTADQPCHGLLAATTNHHRITRWFQQVPRANVGIHAGRSELIVLDLDTKNTPPTPAAHDLLIPVADGLGAFTALCTHAGVDWPDTLTVATPSGGRHLYFQCPKAMSVPSDATGRVGHQIDIRADGGYILAPGSTLTTPPENRFGSYQRISPTVDIAPLPEWLHERVAAPTPPVGPVVTPNWRAGTHTPGYWRHIWQGELDKVETRDGERWRLVYAAARRLANLATHDTAPWTETEAIDALVAAAIRRRQRTGKPNEPAIAERNAQRGWQRGATDTPESLLGLNRTA